jgi:hypothetical protein
VNAVRCSVRSSLRDEPMVGTASTVRRYLLLESPGPWGAEVLRHSRLPPEVKHELRLRSRQTGIRVLLIRRHRQRAVGASRQFFIADVGSPHPRLVHGRLTDPREILDVDLTAPTGVEASADPLFLVCTHGRHDPCCAERGRPLARALAAAFPEQTWECSHLGGDRFAGNLLCLPDGLCYGRVAPEDAAAIGATHLAGRLDLVHLRGRAGYSFAVQAAEWHLRVRLRLVGLNDVVLIGQHTDAADTVAIFDTADAGRWSVRISTSHAPPHPLTCNAVSPYAAPHFQLSAMTQVTA